MVHACDTKGEDGVLVQVDRPAAPQIPGPVRLLDGLAEGSVGVGGCGEDPFQRGPVDAARGDPGEGVLGEVEVVLVAGGNVQRAEMPQIHDPLRAKLLPQRLYDFLDGPFPRSLASHALHFPDEFPAPVRDSRREQNQTMTPQREDAE